MFNRQPKGAPGSAGGQFAAMPRAAADPSVQLDDTVFDEDGHADPYSSGGEQPSILGALRAVRDKIDADVEASAYRSMQRDRDKARFLSDREIAAERRQAEGDRQLRSQAEGIRAQKMAAEGITEQEVSQALLASPTHRAYKYTPNGQYSTASIMDGLKAQRETVQEKPRSYSSELRAASRHADQLARERNPDLGFASRAMDKLDGTLDDAASLSLQRHRDRTSARASSEKPSGLGRFFGR